MLPVLPRDDCRHRAAFQPVSHHQHFVADAARMRRANGNHIGFSDKRTTMSGTFQARTIGPSLGFHVGHVVAMSAEPQMSWFNAERIVAAVQDEHSLGNVAISKHPGYAMGHMMLSSDDSMAIRRGATAGSNPYPAFFCLSDFCPEMLFELFVCKGRWRHAL